MTAIPDQDQARTAAGPAPPHPLGPGGVRALKIAILVMGVMILVGLAVAVGRVVHLSGKPARTAGTTSTITPGAPLRAETRLALPAGTSIKSIALSGDRLAVHYEGAGGTKAGIAVLDAATGEVLSRIEIVPAVP